MLIFSFSILGSFPAVAKPVLLHLIYQYLVPLGTVAIV
jgi:hypothetical protein